MNYSVLIQLFISQKKLRVFTVDILGGKNNNKQTNKNKNKQKQTNKKKHNQTKTKIKQNKTKRKNKQTKKSKKPPKKSKQKKTTKILCMKSICTKGVVRWT